MVEAVEGVEGLFSWLKNRFIGFFSPFKIFDCD